MLLNYIRLPIFFVSFAIGLFFIYVLGPKMKHIYIYPSPDNIDNVLFQDKADNCFRFDMQEIKCPVDSSQIFVAPVQI